MAGSLFPPPHQGRKRQCGCGITLPAGIPGDDQLLFGPGDSYIQEPQPLAGIILPGGLGGLALGIELILPGREGRLELRQRLCLQVELIPDEPFLRKIALARIPGREVVTVG